MEEASHFEAGTKLTGGLVNIETIEGSVEFHMRVSLKKCLFYGTLDFDHAHTHLADTFLGVGECF